MLDVNIDGIRRLESLRSDWGCIARDILLLDVWIGAGDKHFRKKITARIDALIERSRGLVIATHNAA